MLLFSIPRKIHPPHGIIQAHAENQIIDYQSIKILAHRWLYTIQIKQTHKQNLKLEKT